MEYYHVMLLLLVLNQYKYLYLYLGYVEVLFSNEK